LGGNDKVYSDLSISPAFTYGSGQSNSVTLNTFNNNMASGVSNNFENSVTLGTNFVLNSDGRNQRVGYAGFKSGKVDFSFYNDVIPVLGDRDDRWWTGGGSLNIGNFSLATDVFTGLRDRTYYDPKEKAWTQLPGNPAGGTFGTYIQTPYEQSLNSGQTLFGVRFGNISVSSQVHGNQMWSQDFIHNNLGLPPIFGIYINKNLLFNSTSTNTCGSWVNVH
jgi:hypothetical protein